MISTLNLADSSHVKYKNGLCKVGIHHKYDKFLITLITLKPSVFLIKAEMSFNLKNLSIDSFI